MRPHCRHLLLVCFYYALLSLLQGVLAASAYRNSTRSNLDSRAPDSDAAPLLCGTVLSDAARQELRTGLSLLNTTGPAAGRRQAVAHTFDVVFHVVAAGFTYREGWLPDEYIAAQMALLNRHFDGTGIAWAHAGTRRVLSPLWFRTLDSTTREMTLAMQTRLHHGGRRTLNVYTISFNEERVFGFSSYPNSLLAADGIVLSWRTLPGPLSPIDAAGTLTHEAGHWLGLIHPFEGRQCAEDGDLVDDTPVASEAPHGCPVGLDSCPDQPGVDAINNHMGYTSDACRTEFTRGQVARMHGIIERYRPRD